MNKSSTPAEETQDPIEVEKGEGWNFELIPHALMLDKNLSPEARLLYCILVKYANKKTGECYPGQDTLAAFLGVKRRALQGYLLALKKAGWVTVRQRGRKKTNIYVVHGLVQTPEKTHQDAPQPEPDKSDAHAGACFQPCDTNRDAHPLEQYPVRNQQYSGDSEGDVAGATPAPDPPPKKPHQAREPDPRLKHPALEAYKSVVRSWPKHAARDPIIATVGDAEEDVLYWRDVLTDHMCTSGNPGNVKLMLECFREHRLLSEKYRARASPNGGGKAAGMIARTKQAAEQFLQEARHGEV